MTENAMNYLKDYSSLLKNKEFLNLTTSRDRIAFILKFIRPLNLFRRDVHYRADQYVWQHCKSADRSLIFREQGFEYYKNKDYRNAVLMFTKEILSAPIPVEEGLTNGNLWLAFAHKSMAEFHLKDYMSALSSANQSLEDFETLEMLIHRVHCLRLMRRFTECLQYLNELVIRFHSNDGLDLKEQSFEGLIAIKRHIIGQMTNLNDSEAVPQQEIYPSENLAKDLDDYGVNVWLHPGCQHESSERSGRHLVAKQFIPKNTVVLLEQPISVVLSDVRTKMCSNCYKSISASFWPCVGCDEVIFCDKQCFIAGFETYHRYECCISGLLNSLGHSFAHTYQLISKAGVQKAFECEEQNNNFDFESYLEAKRQQIGNISDNDSEEDTDFKTEYEAYHTLANHNSIQDNYSNVYQSFGAIETALLLDYSQQLDFDIEEDFEKFVTLADICIKNVRRVLTNVFGGWQNISNIRTHVGSGFCTVGSLINHSCQPNINWSLEGMKLVYTTKYDINAGEQMCITYGPTAGTSHFLQRQAKLKTNYFFDCNCEACLRECKTVVCIRCNHCSGPLVYTDLGQWVTNRKNRCLECGQEFKNLMQTVAKVEGTKKRFDQMMSNLGNNHNIEWSLKVAQNMMKEMSELVYSKSQPLRQDFKQMVRWLARHNRFAEAIHLIECFGADLDMKYNTTQNMDSLTNETFDDLFLLTKCYYMYLNASQVSDPKHWNDCFQLYTKLIGLLNKKKKASKKNSTTSANSGQREGTLTNKIQCLIKDKKKELKDLKGYYQSISNQI